MRAGLPATLPPDLPGFDPRWSRLVTAADADGVPRTWHVLDTAAGPSVPAFGARNGVAPVLAPKAVTEVGTLLCVHGNPTWSYLWRHVAAAAPPGWRVVAVDHLGMGYSERPASMRRLGRRIDDLGRVTDALGISGPVVTVAHDWGGAISLGWALAHRAQLAGIVLTNTAVHQPAGSPVPGLIRLARAPGLRQLLCRWTPAFVRTAAALSRPPLSRAARRGLAAPYRQRRRRAAIADFVADIPLDDGHPSAAALAAVVAGLPTLADVPALLLWGPRDPVFSERHLRDLMARLPQADVHRFEGAGHLITEDRPEVAGVVADWVREVVGPRLSTPPAPTPADRATSGGLTPPEVAGPVPRRPLGTALAERAADDAPAVVEMGSDGPTVTVSFAELAARVDALAAGLRAGGVLPGDRVALLVAPGVELTAAVYACWRIGAVIVVADAGLGLRKLGRALRGAGPDHVIAVGAGLAAARALRVPGQLIAAGPVPGPLARGLGARLSLAALSAATAEGAAAVGTAAVGAAGAGTGPDDECAVVFTSGATGPPKGVVYRHGQVEAQVALLARTYGIGPDDRLVAAFAPFALYGPALGVTSAVPDMDVTAPATLTAASLADAVDAVRATVVFASPAALRNVVDTAAGLDQRQAGALAGPRLLMSAGAPVPPGLLRSLARLLPGAELHTPYGMTEVLPVTDVTLAQIEAAGPGAGVCVGTAVDGVDIAVSPLDGGGRAADVPRAQADVTGEVCVRAAHGKQRYDRLWATEAASSRDPGFHRTGDVGHLDRAGRLWIEGRLVDVVTTASGPLAPVPVEQRIEAGAGVRAAAIVGVGPGGTQAVVAVVVPGGPDRRGRGRPGGLRLADRQLAGRVRAAAGVELAAVLTTAALPVDIRHNSKIDHAGVARAAGRLLAGRAGAALDDRPVAPGRRPDRSAPVRR